MATSFGALCTDFSVTHKLSLKMDLPGDRETILHLMDRVRKSLPAMEQFRPYENELVLESSRRDDEYRCLALQRRSIRTSFYNPPTMKKAYDFHRLLMELAPFHLTISPLDVDCVDLTFSFDLECKGNHDEVVYDALYADSPLRDLLRIEGVKVLDVQPYFSFALGKDGQVQAFFEVKTRNRTRRGNSSRYRHEPIGLFLTVRRFGPMKSVEELQTNIGELAHVAEALAAEKFVPMLLTPIARQITSSSA
jgi:hypothetical protein